MRILDGSEGIFTNDGDFLALEADVFSLFVRQMSAVNKRAEVDIDPETFNYARTIFMVVNGQGSVGPASDGWKEGDQCEYFDNNEMTILNNLFGTLFNHMRKDAHAHHNRRVAITSAHDDESFEYSDKCVPIELFGELDPRGVPFLLRNLSGKMLSKIGKPAEWLTTFAKALPTPNTSITEARKLLKQHKNVDTYELTDILMVFHLFFNGVVECDRLLPLEQRFRKMTKNDRQERTCYELDDIIAQEFFYPYIGK